MVPQAAVEPSCLCAYLRCLVSTACIACPMKAQKVGHDDAIARHSFTAPSNAYGVLSLQLSFSFELSTS